MFKFVSAFCLVAPAAFLSGTASACGTCGAHHHADDTNHTATDMTLVAENASAFETQRGFAIHNASTAPEASQPSLDWYMENFQFVPHLAGVMAESPALLNSYTALQQNLAMLGTLTPAEDNVVQMAIAIENTCQYCVAGHTMAGSVFFGNSDEEIAAMRAGGDLTEPRLTALRDFALATYESQGRVSEADLQAFYDAGYTRAQALDVVANIAAKVMTNFTNQLAETPIDEAFAPMAEGLSFQEERALIAK